MTPRKIQLILLILITFLLGYFVGVSKVNIEWSHYKPNITVINREPPTTASLVDFSTFWTVWDRITSNYYDKTAVDPQKMLNGAITGMVQSLGDPYTMYLPPTQNANFQQYLAGQFTGIGAELGMKGKQIIVIAPLVGSPAEKAGIKPGDAILAVDGKDMSTWTLQQAVNTIRGPKGTKVTLTILHENSKKAQDIQITRDVITVKSVDGWVKQVKDIDAISQDLKKSDRANDSIVYLRLSQFGDNTNKDWSALITSLVPKINAVSPKGIILDLRDNPGGYVTDAVFIAGEFLAEGKPVVTQDMGNGNPTTFYVNRRGSLLNIPLIVLINGGSASASEIVSGSLRDNDRAKLVGDKSFGKGTMQEEVDLGGGAGLHVSIARWLTPKGTWVGKGVNGTGLTPDFPISLDPKDPSHDTQLEKAIDVLTQ